MSTLADIIGLLDRWPRWKAIQETPDRIAQLEKRVAALEQKSIAAPKQIPKGRECPKCGSEMKVLSEKPDPLMGPAGVKVHEMKCSACDFTAHRQFTARDGYL